jgi:DNA-binding NarL/FixJ family response regulator
MKLLLCDDHAIFREGLKAILAPLGAALLEAARADEALELLARDPDVDIVLLDLAMPGADGWTLLRKLRAEHPALPVVIVSATEDPARVREALAAGAAGFVPKSSSPSVFRSALQLVLEGSLYLPPALLLQPDGAESSLRPGPGGAAPPLTGRQLEILRMLSRGLTNAEIAGVLGIAAGTVKAHVSAIFQALDVSNRTEAALALRELGLEDE